MHQVDKTICFTMLLGVLIFGRPHPKSLYTKFTVYFKKKSMEITINYILPFWKHFTGRYNCNTALEESLRKFTFAIVIALFILKKYKQTNKTQAV